MSVFPKTSRKQRNHRKQFHPAEQHHQHEEPFVEQGKIDVGASWSDTANARTDVAQRGYRCTQGGVEVGTREEQDDTSREENQEINDDEGRVFVDAAGGDGLSVDLHG